MDTSRRSFLNFMAVGAVASTADLRRLNFDNGASDPSALEPGRHQVVPLGFDPKKLDGLSERLLTSHHDNNYAGAIKNLNAVENEISKLTKETPGYLVASLRDRELLYRNSATYHELYFGNLGGNGADLGGVKDLLAGAFGSVAAFEEAFRAIGMGLGGGSGWAVLAFDLHRGSVAMQASANHTQALASSVPLLVMDMYEHAYAMDFGAGAAKYIEAFFRNIEWSVVMKRWAAARSAHAALTSSR